MRLGSSVLGLLFALSTIALGAHEKAHETQSALIFGSVFRPNGLSFPDAEITVEQSPDFGQHELKLKKLKTFSDARGEFAVHVPPVAMRYIVEVKAKGYIEQNKIVSIDGPEGRADVTFRLEAESK